MSPEGLKDKVRGGYVAKSVINKQQQQTSFAMLVRDKKGIAGVEF